MRLFRWLTTAALLLCFCVVVLGAYVRLSDAGLGCPDWPGCYGHWTVPAQPEQLESAQKNFPERPLEHAKAWKEMAHRYLASTLGFVILILTALSFRAGYPRMLPRVLLALVIFQGLLGMWTVTWLLKPLAVTAHLLGGMSTLALLGWLWLDGRDSGRRPSEDSRSPALAPGAAELGTRDSGKDTANELARRLDPHAADFRNEREAWRAMQAGPDAVAESPPHGLKFLAALGLLLLAGQIFLGGWTSSNYAALACPDLPTCQGQWWPELDVPEAFMLWRGLGRSYEYGVLDNRARVTIHHLHRVGALVLSGFLLLLSAYLWRRGGAWKSLAAAVLAALGLQAAMGLGLVLLQLPLPLAAAHNAGAAVLLLAVIMLNHQAWQRRSP